MMLTGLGAALSIDQIYSYALSAGFPPDVAQQMVAIALKESGGNPSAHNTKPPDDSYGLWQINMYGRLLGPRLAAFGISDPSQLFDPATNAAAAYQIWGGNPNNLNIAWAINRGVNQSRYQSYLTQVQSALGTPQDGSQVAAADSPDNPPADASSPDSGSSFPILLAVAALGLIFLTD